MSLVVMKFGGTSVSTKENRAHAIGQVSRELKAGNKVVVVISAMGRKGEPYATDTLLSLLGSEADASTKDLLMSCGETISACVFANELKAQGMPAMAFTAEGAGIRADGPFGAAQITAMDTANVTKALDDGLVPVITGFQGRTADHMTVTLGRGGSDVSAVVIGGYLKADTVDIYTDVAGIAKADPRIVPYADFMQTVSNADMLTLAQWGASVIHPKAVSACTEFGVPELRVRSTFGSTTGTSIVSEDAGEDFIGLAMLKNMVQSQSGTFTFREQQYAQTTEGGSAIITAIYKGSDERRKAVEAVAPAYECNGDVIRVAVPMEKAQDTVKQIYDILNR